MKPPRIPQAGLSRNARSRSPLQRLGDAARSAAERIATTLRFPRRGGLQLGGIDDVGLVRLLNLPWITHALYVAVHLNIPDLLADGPRSCEALASSANCRADRLEQVMRALAGFGLFTRDARDRYANTPASDALRSGDNPWLREYVLLWGEQHHAVGGGMLEMVRTGRTAFECVFGRPLYDHYRAHPEAGERFAAFMNATTRWQCESIARAFDFGAFRHVVDVGGGRASMITSILRTYPNLRGTLLDQPHMAELAAGTIREAGLEDRCRFVGGSFLESVPAGGDLYLIKHVIHDWADEEASQIFDNIAAAMPDDGLLIVVEGILDERDGTDRFLKMRDLEQMAWTGGRVRSQCEFETLFDRAGLRLDGIHRAGAVDTRLLLARKRKPNGR